MVFDSEAAAPRDVFSQELISRDVVLNEKGQRDG